MAEKSSLKSPVASVFNEKRITPIRKHMQMRTCFYLLIFNFVIAGITAQAGYFTLGKFYNYTHAEGTVPKGDYQYSIFVPSDYNPKKSYPVVFCLHGVGRGRFHPDQGKRNMVSDRLKDSAPLMQAIVETFPISSVIFSSRL
jgi:poly(3-hydroxybutyrate) depolymerase